MKWIFASIHAEITCQNPTDRGNYWYVLPFCHGKKSSISCKWVYDIPSFRLPKWAEVKSILQCTFYISMDSYFFMNIVKWWKGRWLELYTRIPYLSLLAILTSCCWIPYQSVSWDDDCLYTKRFCLKNMRHKNTQYGNCRTHELINYQNNQNFTLF